VLLTPRRNVDGSVRPLAAGPGRRAQPEAPASRPARADEGIEGGAAGDLRHGLLPGEGGERRAREHGVDAEIRSGGRRGGAGRRAIEAVDRRADGRQSENAGSNAAALS
jgi:hypothetical protein